MQYNMPQCFFKEAPAIEDLERLVSNINLALVQKSEKNGPKEWSGKPFSRNYKGALTLDMTLVLLGHYHCKPIQKEH